MRRNFLFPEEAEAEIKDLRKKDGIDAKTEKIIVKNLIENAKAYFNYSDMTEKEREFFGIPEDDEEEEDKNDF